MEVDGNIHVDGTTALVAAASAPAETHTLEYSVRMQCSACHSADDPLPLSTRALCLQLIGFALVFPSALLLTSATCVLILGKLCITCNVSYAVLRSSIISSYGKNMLP